MNGAKRFLALAAGAIALAGGAARGQEAAPAPARLVDVVATAHLDTQWRWTVKRTIDEYLPATLRENFALFEKYPGYRFSFEGAFRYGLMREYYPREYERMRGYAREGRWNVCGSWVDAVDVNLPAPESLVRHALYGNGFFRRELGVTSRDVFLPDCFGFGWALPTIAAHCGLLGFSTQKLTWGSAYGVPFDVGLWEGPDGSTLVAALQPGSYVSRLRGDPSADTTLAARLDRQAAAGGLGRTVRYIGTGDTGGAPAESSVFWLQRALDAPAGPLAVRSSPADLFAREIAALPPPARERLPRWRGELLMTDHGAGCYTSQAEMKRLNRANERLADAAERAAVAADWLGGAAYPREALRESWIRFLWHQFHDDLTGTSVPEAYVHSWNDEAIAASVFGQVLEHGVGAVARALDTRARGVPLVVYNPLSIGREDVVEAVVPLPGGPAPAVRVFGPAGVEVPAQALGPAPGGTRVAFLAVAPPVGFAVYDVRAARAPAPAAGALRAEADARGARLENARYLVGVDAAGDVVSVVDKAAGRELLSAPIRLQLLDDEPREWPAWEIDHEDIMAPPRAVVGGPARLRVVESGPARVAVEIAREAAGSTFVQRVLLAAGAAGDRVEFAADIDWRTPGTLLKAAFPLAASDTAATYDLGTGTIRRGVNRPGLYEVPAQRWADLAAADGSYGVAVLSDSRHGWDRPDAGTLRLTLVHTPRVNPGWTWVADQGSQDLGRHRLGWALAAHEGDWRRGGVPWRADRFDQPLRAFVTTPHRGPLGASFSLLRVTAAGPAGAAAAPPPVAARAVKLAEESDEIVVRLQELAGEGDVAARVEFARPVLAARAVNGAEEPLDGPFAVREGVLHCDLKPYQPRAFAVRLAPPPARLDPPVARPLDLPWNLDGISDDDAPADGDFDGAGTTIAGELLPAEGDLLGLPIRTGPRGSGQPNVVACRGQTLRLPPGRWDRLVLLACAVGGDRDAAFRVGDAPVVVRVPDHAEPIAQWDSRLVAGGLETEPSRIVPGYEKPATVGWIGTHRHDARGRNEAYAFTHAFRVALPLPRGARAVTLPDDPRVRILAATVARDPNAATAAAAPPPPAGPTLVTILAPRRAFTDSIVVALASPEPGVAIRYTLDGSEPGPASPTYAAPLVLRDSAVLRARACAPGRDDRYVARAAFTRVALRPTATPAAPAGTRPGLAFDAYEGCLDSLAALAGLAPARSGTLPAVALPPEAPVECFALVLRGWLLAPADGLYTLSLRTDDGSDLRLDGDLVIDADGLHGEGDDRAEVALAAGPHAIELRYFQKRGDRALGLWWEGPGFGWEPVPPAALRR